MTNTKPTDAEVVAEIAALTAMQPHVDRFTYFGDDNQAAIEAQLDVLIERMTLTEVEDRFGEDAFLNGDGFDEYIHEAAMNAADWLSGDLGEDEPKPSVSWAGLVRKEQTP